jgi:hypothetical protein
VSSEDKVYGLTAKSGIDCLGRNALLLDEVLNAPVGGSGGCLDLSDTLSSFKSGSDDLFGEIVETKEGGEGRGYKDALIWGEGLKALLQHLKVCVGFRHGPSLGEGEDDVDLVGKLRVVVSEDLQKGLAKQVVVFLQKRLIYFHRMSILKGKTRGQ